MKENKLDVTCTDNLLPQKYLKKITGEVYCIISVAFAFLGEKMGKKLTVPVILPNLDYAHLIWSPHKKEG